MVTLKDICVPEVEIVGNTKTELGATGEILPLCMRNGILGEKDGE